MSRSLLQEMRYRFARLTGDSYKLFHDLAALVGGQLMGKLLGFAAFAWLGRVLDPELYGAAEYIVALTLFAAMLVDGGLDVIGIRRVAQDKSEQPILAFQIPLARVILAVGSAGFIVIMANFALAVSVPPMLIWLYALSMLLLPLSQLWLFRANERMFAAAFADVVRAGVFATLVWALVRGNSDVAKLGIAEITAVAAFSLYGLVFQHLYIERLRWRGSFAGFTNLIREGAVVSSTNLVWALGQYVPLFLIGAMLGARDIAYYAAASRIVVALLTFSNIYHLNLYPTVTRAFAKSSAELAKLLRDSFRVTAWGGIWLALILALFATPLVRLAMGPKLVDAAPLLAVMGAMLPLTLLSGHARWSLVAAGAQIKVLTAQLIGLGVTVLVALAAGHWFGTMGYALAANAGFIAVWQSSDRLARQAKIETPSFSLMLRPLLLAAAIMATAWYFELGGASRLFAVFGYALCAPFIDNRLLGALIALGQAKRQFATGVIP